MFKQEHQSISPSDTVNGDVIRIMGDPQRKNAAMQPLLEIASEMYSKKAMEYERSGNCLRNARQKSRYVFSQNFIELVYMNRHQSLLTAFVPGSI